MATGAAFLTKSVPSWTYLAWVAVMSIFDKVCAIMNISGMGGSHEPTFVCSSLVKGKITWLCPEESRFIGGGGGGGGGRGGEKKKMK